MTCPYPFFSLPVLLGTIGGVLLTIGTAGLIWVKIAGDPAIAAPNLMGPDFALLVLLLLSAVTGLLLLAFRATGAMGPLLAIHFGVVLALFVLLPYCKFVHGVYRSLALLRWAKERKMNRGRGSVAARAARAGNARKSPRRAERRPREQGLRRPDQARIRKKIRIAC